MKKQLTGPEAREWIDANLKNLQKQLITKMFDIMSRDTTTKRASDYRPTGGYRCVLTYDAINHRPVLTVEE